MSSDQDNDVNSRGSKTVNNKVPVVVAQIRNSSETGGPTIIKLQAQDSCPDLELNNNSSNRPEDEDEDVFSSPAPKMRTLWPPDDKMIQTDPEDRRPRLPESHVDDPGDDGDVGGHDPDLDPSSAERTLGLVTNRWERERRKQMQEAARRDTLLRQRKMSAVIKVETLQRSLRSSKEESNKSATSLQFRIDQVKQLEKEVEAADLALDSLSRETAMAAATLERGRRRDHIRALQKLGLLDSDQVSSAPHDDADDASGPRSHHQPLSHGWHSEYDLITKNKTNNNNKRRHLARLMMLSETRTRSGSDPQLRRNKANGSSGGDGNNGRKPFMSYLMSGVRSRSSNGNILNSTSNNNNANNNNNHKTEKDSLKRGRRNPLRMLSNAMDLRHHHQNGRGASSSSLVTPGDGRMSSRSQQQQGRVLTKSRSTEDESDLEEDRVMGLTPLKSSSPVASSSSSSGNSNSSSSKENEDSVDSSRYVTAPPPMMLSPIRGDEDGSARLMSLSAYDDDDKDAEDASPFGASLSAMRHSLPNLEPDAMDSPSLQKAALHRSHHHHIYGTAPRHPSSSGSQQQQERLFLRRHQVPSHLQQDHLSSLPPLHPLENRCSAPEIVVGGTGGIAKPPRRAHSGLEEKLNRLKQLRNINGSSHTLSSYLPSRANSSNKLNRFSAHAQMRQLVNSVVKRSRTFNVSDIQDELLTSTAAANSRTLPNPRKNKKLIRESEDHSSCYGSGCENVVDNNSTASSRKSSNSGYSSTSSTASSGVSSGADSSCASEEVSQEILDEIASFAAFAKEYLAKNPYNKNNDNKNSKSKNRSSSEGNRRKLSTTADAEEVVV